MGRRRWSSSLVVVVVSPFVVPFLRRTVVQPCCNYFVYLLLRCCRCPRSCSSLCPSAVLWSFPLCSCSHERDTKVRRATIARGSFSRPLTSHLSLLLPYRCSVETEHTRLHPLILERRTQERYVPLLSSMNRSQPAVLTLVALLQRCNPTQTSSSLLATLSTYPQLRRWRSLVPLPRLLLLDPPHLRARQLYTSLSLLLRLPRRHLHHHRQYPTSILPTSNPRGLSTLEGKEKKG